MTELTEFQKNLKPGDRVRLIKPFRYDEDDEGANEMYDQELRAESQHGSVLGTVDEYSEIGDGNSGDAVCVRYDNGGIHGQVLWTERDCLGPDFEPVSNEELQAVIGSILGEGGGHEVQGR